MSKYIFSILCSIFALTVNAQSFTLSGQVLTNDGDGVSGAVLEVVDESETVVAALTTDCTGNFTFTDLLGGTDYTLRAEKQGSIQNGNSTFDLVLISQHILGIVDLPNAYYRAAADVDESGSISVFDLLLMRGVILAILDSYPGQNWFFFRPGDQFPSAEFDFILNGDLSDFDLITVKKGDVNASAFPCE